jgi:hypothetical protein
VSPLSVNSVFSNIIRQPFDDVIFWSSWISSASKKRIDFFYFLFVAAFFFPFFDKKGGKATFCRLSVLYIRLETSVQQLCSQTICNPIGSRSHPVIWPNRIFSVTGPVWLITPSRMILIPCACAFLTNAARSSLVPKLGSKLVQSPNSRENNLNRFLHLRHREFVPLLV